MDTVGPKNQGWFLKKDWGEGRGGKRETKSDWKRTLLQFQPLNATSRYFTYISTSVSQSSMELNETSYSVNPGHTPPWQYSPKDSYRLLEQ